jgi:RNAse (barnase) inhibitor barstar
MSTNQREWHIDFDKLRSKDSMLKKIAVVLEFPAHFGRNLDALYDCLTDLPLQKGGHYAIHLDNLERSPAADALHAVFADAREHWAEAGITLAITRE